LQHLAQAAASPQQAPVQAEAAGLSQALLEQEPQLLQPVLSRSPMAQIAPSIIIFILVL
jgi:hypothetical protein